ncbi:threonine dehydratase [Calothrix membranacea FACHB-236]|nr:threonine dehydratase [Calothrix membranacea FACHB-236]
MSRLTQILQNFYLRVEGFLSVIWNKFANVIKSFFGFFAKLFGLTESGYFLESDAAQTTKRVETPQQIETKQNTPVETPANRRRSNAKMDYYLNMARDIKKG